jgi:multiple sugar transport system ATP-binding protein
MGRVTLEHVTKRFDNTVAVNDLSLAVADEEFLVLLGPSGCGKSTALRMIAGLETPTDGTISIGDRVVNDVEAKDRDIAMVFQSYALYPHMSVRENLEFGLKMRGVPRDESSRRIDSAAEILGLSQLLERKPKELSGGQRQRVAIARALVNSPSIILADEPTGNLDSKTGVEIMTLFDQLQARGNTIVLVTHEPDIAEYAHRVVHIRDGQIYSDEPSKRFKK